MDATELAAFVEREHEFRFVAVEVADDGMGDGAPRAGILCAAWSDAGYRDPIAGRCTEAEFARRYLAHGVDRIWRDDVLPCPVYARHCVLASRRLSATAAASFLDETYLADRTTPLRAYLESNPHVMASEPPPELVGRYSG